MRIGEWILYIVLTEDDSRFYLDSWEEDYSVVLGHSI